MEPRNTRGLDEEIVDDEDDHDAQKGAPGQVRRPVRADLLEGVEDATQRGTECGGDACRGTHRDPVALLGRLPQL